MTPSCVTSLLATAGFEVREHAPETFSHTFICTAVDVPFGHDLPGEADARLVGEQVSAAGIARPA